MSNANVLKALSENEGCLENLVLYGRVRCAIERPDVLGKSLKNVDTGAYAILDCYCIKCQGTDYFKTAGTTSQPLYFTKGSVLIYIDSPKWIGLDVKVFGSSFRNGVKFRQQFNHKKPYDGMSAFIFKVENNKYYVCPNSIIELGDHDEALLLTPFEDFIVKLKKDEPIQYSETLDSIMTYVAVEEYTELTSFVDKKVNFVESNEKIDVSKIDLNLTYHLEANDISVMYDGVKEEIESMSKKRRMYLKDLLNELSAVLKSNVGSAESSAKDIRKAFIQNVATKYSENIGYSAVKGKVYVKELLSSFLAPPITASEMNNSNEEDLKFKLPEVSQAIQKLQNVVQAMPEILYSSEIDGLSVPSMQDDRVFALSVISVSTGISLESFRNNFKVCSRLTTMSFGVWFFTLLNYPYLLGMLGSSLNIVDLDKVYFSYTKCFTKGILAEKNGEMRSNLLYLQTLEGASDKDTLISEKTLRGMSAKYPQMGTKFLSMNKFPAKKDLVDLLNVICGSSIALSDTVLDYLKNMRWYSKERTNFLISIGVVNSINDDLILEKDLEKEFMIYSVLKEKGMTLSGITEEQVRESTAKFESNCGFSLEPLQRDGIKLCMYKAGVLSGCAGSGKTTTSECMTDCITDNLKGYSLVYGTPTGKACRRLAEVVHGTVRTLHSEFNIGLYGESYLSDVTKRFKKKKNDKSKGCVYILDEMAMSSSSLLYEVVRSLAEEDLIYFLGDIKQLPPIGKGNPFALLMQFLPCVELGVSKRAAEGSQVNYNTTLINCVSDDLVHELYYDNETFLCKECQDVEIPAEVSKMWKGFMDGTLVGKKFEEKDIQVISGYAKPDVLFSSVNLNKAIQPLLRSKDKLLFKNGDTDFYQNERVIHVKVNSYGKQRYIEPEKGTLIGVVTTGMVNGETGILEGIVRSDMVEIVNFSEGDLDRMDIYKNLDKDELERLLEAREEKEEQMQDDSNIKDENTYFVKVRVYDVDLGADVFVLYQGRIVNQSEGVYLSGSELGNLELAYALTTHKMQGSQSQVVILPFGTTCNPRFINRNMINTMITRSQGVVGMVGSIKGSESPVTLGRQIPSAIKTKDMLSILVDTEETE